MASVIPSDRMSASCRSTRSGVIGPFQNHNIVGRTSDGGLRKRSTLRPVSVEATGDAA